MAATLEEAREESKGLKEENGFKPVIVKTEYKKGKFIYGVQFWSDFLIGRGVSENSDRTFAKFIERV